MFITRIVSLGSTSLRRGAHLFDDHVQASLLLLVVGKLVPNAQAQGHWYPHARSSPFLLRARAPGRFPSHGFFVLSARDRGR